MTGQLISKEQGEKTPYHEFIWFVLGQYKSLSEMAKKQQEKKPKPKPVIDLEENELHFSQIRVNSESIKESEKEETRVSGSQRDSSTSEEKRETEPDPNEDGEELDEKSPEELESEKESKIASENHVVLKEKHKKQKRLISFLMEFLEEMLQVLIEKILQTYNGNPIALQNADPNSDGFSEIMNELLFTMRNLLKCLLEEKKMDFMHQLDIKQPTAAQSISFEGLRKSIKKMNQTEKLKNEDDCAVYFCKKLLKIPEVARKIGKMIISMGVEDQNN